MMSDYLEEIQQTKTTKFVKRLDELQPHEPGYEVASRVERRNRMRDMEDAIQKKWQLERTFQEDADDVAPAPANADRKKFFCNFPYPYMNGLLHLGHAFTITKADFAAGYQRLKGKKVLFPFAFHCTGMPIQAAAHKLQREIYKEYGLENCQAAIFERRDTGEDAAAAALVLETQGLATLDDEDQPREPGAPGKRPKTQWEILQLCDVPDHEIPKFCDPQYWLQYFPPLAMEHLKYFGVHVDWRRSFITTDTNPYYDSFIQWQFRRLRKEGKIAFGKRPTVYSRRDRQACMDHDRASGEGKGPQEYTLIKMRLIEDGVPTLVDRVPAMAPIVSEPIFLVAATLRPETMYGQTNCFVLPEGIYGAYRMKSGEIFVCSEHSAVNMAHQAEQDDMMAIWGETDKIADMTGRNLMGLPLKAPYAQYDRIYTLPLLTISMDKGTGIVTSVPSDAPDDYAALKDLQTKPGLRQEYGITEDMVAEYKPISIIHIPDGDPDIGVKEWGDMAAVNACEHLGVQDQHDKAKLAKIKKSVYNNGFKKGVMTVGAQTGKKVEEAKEAVKMELLDAGLAVRYWEPEDPIMSRTGDKCIVAFIDQWYLKYGEPTWKDAVMEHVRDKTGQEGAGESKGGTANKVDSDAVGEEANTFDAFGVRTEHINTLEWLGSWACSRSFGLGTKLPWDQQFVIESLSDSTIYMAYYTVAALLQGEDNAYGSKPGPLGIAVEDLNDDVWHYIFCKGGYPKGCRISQQDLDKLRNEFEFWYPFDLRVSGKDLIRNHLTMCLYNHAAIWPDNPELWPRSFFTNGHVMVDSQKMSKSAGNFISLVDAVRGDNVHLHIPVEKRKINKVVVKAETKVATVTTKQPHGLAFGHTVEVSKSKNNDGKRTITSVPSDTTFTFSSAGEDNSNSVEIDLIEKKWSDCEWQSQSWTTDTVRYALAVAGDTMNDANFESEVANGMILKLENELNWAEEVMSAAYNLRDGVETMTIQDKLFLIRMDECIRETDNMYEQMKFALAMKFGFSDMRIHRKVYREYHEKCGLQMHRSVIRKYLEALVIMMTPVMTHWSEYIWGSILKNEGTVTRAPWPAESGLPSELLLQDKYLQEVVASFRKQLTKKKGKQAPEKTPTRAIIFVQPEFPSWKKKAVQWLGGQWDDEMSEFKDPKSVLAGAVKFQKADDELKVEKMFMKYIGYVMGQTKALGRAALATQMPFDELSILEESKTYLAASIGLSDGGVQVVKATDEPVDDRDGKKSLAEPGKPSLAAF